MATDLRGNSYSRLVAWRVCGARSCCGRIARWRRKTANQLPGSVLPNAAIDAGGVVVQGRRCYRCSDDAKKPRKWCDGAGRVVDRVVGRIADRVAGRVSGIGETLSVRR